VQIFERDFSADAVIFFFLLYLTNSFLPYFFDFNNQLTYKITFPMLFHTKKSSDRMVKEELPNQPFRGIIS